MAESSLRFRFSAYDENGTPQSGVIEADSEADAVRRLTRSGKIPFEVTQTKQAARAGNRSWKLAFETRLDLTRLFTDLAVMLNSGFNIDIALRAVADADIET